MSSSFLDEDLTSIEVQLFYSESDGIILFASDLPIIAKAIRDLVDRTFMVTISTDISESGRHCYVGINNVNAGRSAAKLSEAICRKGGRILVVEPGTSARSNLDRVTGFCEFFHTSRYDPHSVLEFWFSWYTYSHHKTSTFRDKSPNKDGLLNNTVGIFCKPCGL